MKEFIAIAVSFLMVVALSFYMYSSNQNHSISVKQTKEIEEMLIKSHDELKNEIYNLKNHIEVIDSIYHKK